MLSDVVVRSNGPLIYRAYVRCGHRATWSAATSPWQDDPQLTVIRDSPACLPGLIIIGCDGLVSFQQVSPKETPHRHSNECSLVQGRSQITWSMLLQYAEALCAKRLVLASASPRRREILGNLVRFSRREEVADCCFSPQPLSSADSFPTSKRRA